MRNPVFGVFHQVRHKLGYTATVDQETIYYLCSKNKGTDQLRSYCTAEPGAIAWSVAMSLGKQEALCSILMSGTFSHEDFVINIFLRPFFLLPLIQEERLSANGELFQEQCG